MADDVRFGILGTGHMAQTFAAALTSVDGVALAGFCSRDEERAKTFSTYFGAPVHFATLADLLADPAVDALYIAHDSANHAESAIAGLEAGKAVLCEKPCGIDAAQARAIAATAERTGKLFMEAIPTPFLPAVTEAITAAQSGELGMLRRFSANFGYPASPQSHPACFAAAGGGVLLDRAIYPVTLALLTMEPVRDVHAIVTHDEGGIAVEAWITLLHDSGATSSLGASFLSELDNRLSIAGTMGSAFVEGPFLAAERFAITRYGAPTRSAPEAGGLVARLKRKPILRRTMAIARAARMPYRSYGTSIYAGEIAHFRDLMREGKRASHLLPPALSIAALEILDRAKAQAS